MQADSVLFAMVALGACSPFDPSLSRSPFFCGTSDPKCPDGYECKDPGGGGMPVCMVPGAGPGIDSGGGTCTMAFSGVLATWDFVGESGAQTSTTASSSATGLTATSVSRSAPLAPAAGADSINATNWPTDAQLDPASYFTLSITAPTGCTVDLTSVAIDVKSSSTGPASAVLGTSADTFASAATVSTATPSMAAVTAHGASLEVRIFGFDAQSTGGTMRVENTLSLTGAIR